MALYIRHEDIAVLDKFFAYQSLVLLPIRLSRVYEENIKQTSLGSTIHNNLWVIFSPAYHYKHFF